MKPEITKSIKPELAKTFREQLKALCDVYAKINRYVLMFVTEIPLNQKMEDIYIETDDINSVCMDILKCLNLKGYKEGNVSKSKNLNYLQDKLEVSNLSKYDFSTLLKLLAKYRTNQNSIGSLYLCKLVYNKENDWDSFLEKYIQICIELNMWPTLFDEANC